MPPTCAPIFTYRLAGSFGPSGAQRRLTSRVSLRASSQKVGWTFIWYKRLWLTLRLVAFQRSKLFDLAVESAPVDWAPPGELVKSYQASDGTYEIWKGSLADPAVKQLVNRIQVLVPLFIEGGTFIGTHVSDGLARWTVFFLYRKTNAPGPGITPYEFAGYSTVYRFFYFKKPTERRLLTAADFKLPFESFTVVEEPARTRISQFIILPPFQHKGNAGQLYSTIFQHYLDSPEVVEITVEDPNEAFDDLRDLTDRSYLLGIPEFHSIKIDTSVVFEPGRASKNPVDEAAVEELRLKTKIAPRQFHRLVEMQLMSRLPVSVRPRIEDEPRVAATDAEKHEYRLWKGLVKQRLYRRNKEILGQLDREERIQKLDETLGAVEMEYARLLAAAADRAKHGEQTAKPKRGLEANSSEPTSKKARLDTQ